MLRAADFEQTQRHRNSDIQLPASGQCGIEQYPASGRPGSVDSGGSDHPAATADSNHNENLESRHRFDLEIQIKKLELKFILRLKKKRIKLNSNVIKRLK